MRTAEPNRVPGWVMPLVKIGILVIDACLAFGCFALAFYWREGYEVFSGSGGWSEQFVPYRDVALFLIAVRILTLAYHGTYRMEGAFSYVNETIKIFKAVITGSLFVIAFTFLSRGGFEFRTFSYSRGVFLIDFLLALAVFIVFHLGLRYVQSIFRKRDINLVPTLIVGTNAEARQTLKELQDRRALGFRVVGMISTGEGDLPVELMEPGEDKIGIVGTLAELPEIIKELSIQEVIITDTEIPSEILFETMMQTGRKRRVEFRLAPSLYNFLPQKTSVEQIGILPMVRLFREPLSDVERFVKRFSDIAISAVTLIVLSPVWLLAALLIKLDTRGNILFAQERVGMDGRKFLCFKFRTMQSDADESVHREAYSENIKGVSETSGGNGKKQVFGKIVDDPRITKAGRMLRRSSLDELPQLLNVLKGDMSIVGPRPPIPYEVEEYSLWHRKRLDMKPGITGLWQVSGRNSLTFEEMVKIDLYYIENWSFWLDLKVIALTLPAMLRGEGES